MRILDASLDASRRVMTPARMLSGSVMFTV